MLTKTKRIHQKAERPERYVIPYNTQVFLSKSNWFATRSFAFVIKKTKVAGLVLLRQLNKFYSNTDAGQVFVYASHKVYFIWWVKDLL